MRIFSFSGLRIVRLRPRWPLPAGANRLVHGRLRRFHPSAQPRACGCPRSASFSGPDALRMRPGRSPENISGNMSEDMSGNLSGVLPERASRRSSGWLRKEARTALREVLQTTLWETRRRRSGKSCNGVPGNPADGAPGNPANDVPGSPATASLGRLGARHPGPRTRRSPRARRPEPVLFGCGEHFSVIRITESEIFP